MTLRSTFRLVRLSIYSISAAVLTVVASYSGEFWWLPLLLFAVAAIVVFLVGEASTPVAGKKASYLVASVLSLPLIISIAQQIIEDMGRSYSSNDYALTDPLAIIHVTLVFAGFASAHRAGQWFARRGVRTRGGSVALRAVRFVAVPLMLLGVFYFALIAWFGSTESELIASSSENVGLALAHVTFASVLLGVSSATFIFATRRLQAPHD